MATYHVSTSLSVIFYTRSSSDLIVTANPGDLKTVIGGGFSQKSPMWFTQVPGPLVLASNGIDPMQRWDPATGIMEVAGVPAPATAVTIGTVTGTTSATAAGAFIYAFCRFYDNYGNFSDLSPIGIPISGYSIVSTIQYLNVPIPTGPYALKVVGRQILRNAVGEATVFYIDIDTRDLTSSTFQSYLSDDISVNPNLSDETALPLLDSSGRIFANTNGFPPSWKSATASYLGRVFAASENVYSDGNISVTSYSDQVYGIGTQWPQNFSGRVLYISNPPGEYLIKSVDPVNQILTLYTTYNGPNNSFAIYGIRADSSEWRLVYYTPTNRPESWPPTYALSLQDDGDEISGLMQLGSFLYILEQRHIYRLTFLTDPAVDGAIFLSSRRGCLNQRMWVQAEATAYMFDQLGVHAFTGGTSLPISDQIQDLWRDNSDSDFVINWNADTSLWSCSYNAQHTTIRFFVAMTGSRYPRHALAYNYRQNRWWIEEYQRPICSTQVMRIGTSLKTVAGLDANTISCLDVGHLDGSRGITPTLAGVVDEFSACSLTDMEANFTSEVINLSVAITQGRAKGQIRRIVNVTNNGTRLALKTPWNIAPEVGDVYMVASIEWYWQAGWFRMMDDAQGVNSRDIEVLFKPQEIPKSSTPIAQTADLQVYFNRTELPRIWQSNRDGTATVTSGDSRIELDLTNSSGRGIFRMEGHRERYLDGDVYMSPELSGFQHETPIRIFRVTINGVVQDN